MVTVKKTSSGKSKLVQRHGKTTSSTTSLVMKCIQGAVVLLALLILFTAFMIHSHSNSQGTTLEQQQQSLHAWSPIHMKDNTNQNHQNVQPLAPMSNQHDGEAHDEAYAALSSVLSSAAEQMGFNHFPQFSSDTSKSTIGRQNGGSAMEAFDLTVNHMPTIPFPKEFEPPLDYERHPVTAEDFLPLVIASEVQLRFRLRPLIHAPLEGLRDISAYQIICQRAAHSGSSNDNAALLWDSGKVDVTTMPRSIPYGGDTTTLTIGTVVQWKVLVWDAQKKGPAISPWAKFGVGPRHDEWKAKWITHRADYDTLKNEQRQLKRGNLPPRLCELWKQRRPLPLARAEFTVEETVTAALLVVSGLGSFSVALDGHALSTSSVQDPPLTDYSQRVSYRGYDVTEALLQKSGKHVVAITLGSGWWDGLPINGKIVFQDLMPKGSLTTIAELHLTLTDGTTVVKIPTGVDVENADAGVGWKVGKGHIIESNLYTGETINVGTLHKNDGWDSTSSELTGNKPFPISWEDPVLYKAGISVEEWHLKLQGYAYDHIIKEASNAAPIGKLVPIQMPPVMPIERIAPEQVSGLGEGRWLYDFGKGFSGVVRFEKGLPTPIVPKEYPRNHNVTDHGAVDFITVVYGDTLEMKTGDINLVLVAGYGYHNGGWRRKAGLENPARGAGPCWPKDHAKVLTQRDVYILPKDDTGSSQSNAAEAFGKARQSRFTFHGFRFAEVCCTEEPPTDVYAIKYRTAFSNWGEFDSSNPILNGAYEMTRNSFDSNMLSVQSDCPHREKLQYGGDMVANSPAAFHYFDVSAFYSKIVEDWTDSQWDNGAYTTTSVFMDILRDMSIGQKGSGETVWAALPPVLTVRHMHNYGDIQLVERTLDNHIQWMDFLLENWAAGMERKYPGALQNYKGGGSGLGDWLAMMPRDSWLTHHAFYLASIRAVAYLANQLIQKVPNSDKKEHWESSLKKATEKNAEIETMIRSVYKGSIFSYSNHNLEGLGQNLGLFSRIVNGTDRCTTLRSWLNSAANCRDRSWPGDEEAAFYNSLNAKDQEELINGRNLFPKRNNVVKPRWHLRYAVNSGILDVKYTFKTLSDMGFHDIGLSKASGNHFPGYGYMMSFNATTLWETWWRSEDLYSHNHPMFGAIGEWLPSSVAGITLEPTTVGGEDLIFWPRIPMNRLVVDFASALQGTKRGDAAIAWKFVGSQDATTVKVVIRALVPPSTRANLRLPPKATNVTMRVAKEFPDLYTAKEIAALQCEKKRGTGQHGYPYFYHYDREKNEWTKINKPSRTGTPCDSFLWYVGGNDDVAWESYSYEPVVLHETSTQSPLQPGLFEIEISDWKFEDPLPDVPGYGDYQGDMGPYCSDPNDFVWDVNDGLHM
eukprot:CAMPEP_0168761210 /NCGR_PEP_ID=MMETSP0724-20121128/23195_1 /TAXON_ID=265536 /ORGANISM="Amphiprora sp., Strain CCMP467" /LENGTH=1371 /DNA_ID=CAMNT_0008810305 /DNA_START=162 /DNA_END=4274 /DNA_ORIENTATION=-